MSGHFEEQEFNTDTLDTSLWKRIFVLLLKHKKKLIVLFSMMFFIAGADIGFPYLNKLAIDTYVSNNGDVSGLWAYGAAYITLIFIQGLGVFIFVRQAGRIEMDFAYDVRKQAFAKLQELSFTYYDKTPQGWIMARMSGDIGRLAEILSWSLIDLFWGSALIIGTSTVMLLLNWKLALLVLFVVPILAFLSVKFQRMILEKYRETRKINSKITGAFSEGITGAKTTKTLVLEDYQTNEFKQLTSSMRSQSIRAAILSAVFMPMVMGLGAISSALLLWQGGQQVLVGSLQFGTLVLFTQYAAQFFEPLRQIARLLAEFQMAQASAERVLSLLSAEVDLKDSEDVIKTYGTILDPKPQTYEKLRGDVRFENVSFYYKPEEPVLKDFNLSVNAGETIALVGETGSGKSTLVNLICRFYEVKSGRILIDGIDITQRSIGWLHSNLGYVLQTPHLFSGSVLENIRYGRLDASDEEVIAASKMVSAHTFIEALDEGYQSDVGEGGNRLSTGQKQLISFARAVLASPSLFILDEATSSIDTETEQLIQHAIETLMQGRTSFIIAHRLSTIVKSDRILVLRKGVIVEDGNHATLMEKKGYYYRLYTNQFNLELQNALLKEDKKDVKR